LIKLSLFKKKQRDFNASNPCYDNKKGPKTTKIGSLVIKKAQGILVFYNKPRTSRLET
jgi:hypothetical protein